MSIEQDRYDDLCHRCKCTRLAHVMSTAVCKDFNDGMIKMATRWKFVDYIAAFDLELSSAG
jgi:hypothetical protein